MKTFTKAVQKMSFGREAEKHWYFQERRISDGLHIDMVGWHFFAKVAAEDNDKISEADYDSVPRRIKH